MSTTGTVINYVFDAISQLDDKNGAPLHDIVDTVSRNLANDHVVAIPRNMLIHARRAIDFGLHSGFISQLSPDMYKLNVNPIESDEDDRDGFEPMDYQDCDANSYASDDDGSNAGQAYYSRGISNATENPYYRDRVMKKNKNTQQKRGFQSIPANPVGPTEPEEPTGPGTPRPPLDPPSYEGRPSRLRNQKKNYMMKKMVTGSPDDNDEMNDDDHDCDFDGDSADYDGDICSEEFCDFDDAEENQDDAAADDNDDDDDDDDQESDEEDEEPQGNETQDKGQQNTRQAKFTKPLKKSDKRNSREPVKPKRKKQNPKRDDASNSSCSCCSDAHARRHDSKPKRSKSRFNENNKYHTLALPSHSIMKRSDRDPISTKKRNYNSGLPFGVGKLSQSHEDCGEEKIQ